MWVTPFFKYFFSLWVTSFYRYFYYLCVTPFYGYFFYLWVTPFYRYFFYLWVTPFYRFFFYVWVTPFYMYFFYLWVTLSYRYNLLPMGISCYFCCFDRQVNQTSKTVDEVHNHKGVLKQRINKESSSCKTRWSIKRRRKNLVPFTTEITCYLQLRAVNFKYSYIWSMLVYS